jgi:hypothetical protein
MESTDLNIVKKKRGRKSKILTDNNITTKPTVPILKKRGRKPKNQLIENVNTDKNDKIKVILSKELDLNNEVEYNNEVSPINNIWLSKYQPQKLDEIIGNKEQINIIQKWLLNFENSDNHAIVISGSHGIGKNLLIKLLLIETGYNIKNIYSTNLKNKNIISEIIHNCSNTKNIYKSFNQSINQKYAIVIDDTESITLTSEKDNLLELFKFNSEHRYFPLIFISNLQHSKLINNLKKMSLDISLNAPPIDEIKHYIKNICSKESMNIQDDNIYIQIIKFCQSDIRRLLYVLQDLFYTYNKQIITIEMFKEYQYMTQKKDIDVGLYFAAKNLLDDYKNINKCLQLYETEKVLLPLTIYENYYKKIFKQSTLTNDTILDIMSNITNSVSIGDVIETNIYSDQNWFLQNIHGFYTCVNTSYTMNNIINNNNINNTKNKIPKVKLNYDLVFSADLNKTSSKNINKKKNISMLQLKFKNKNIDDILYINKIFFELEKNKNTSIIKSLKNIYNLDNKNIQIALKIDKTNIKIMT